MIRRISASAICPIFDWPAIASPYENGRPVAARMSLASSRVLEPRGYAEAEIFNLVIISLEKRIGDIHPQRAEGRIPGQPSAGRGAQFGIVEDFAHRPHTGTTRLIFFRRIE